MALTNAERQARHRARVKAKLEGVTPVSPGDEYERGSDECEELFVGAYYSVGKTWAEFMSDPDDEDVRASVARFMGEQIGAVDIILIMQEAAFRRLNQFHMKEAARPRREDKSVGEMPWRKHAASIAPKAQPEDVSRRKRGVT
jgi:hypothetical protein